MTFRRLSNILIVAIASVFILYIGKDLLIPFFIAILFWFITKQIRSLINRVGFLRKKVPDWIKNIFSLGVILLVFNFVLSIVYNNFEKLVKSKNKYSGKMDGIISSLNDTLNINLMDQAKIYFEDFDFSSVALTLFNYSSGIVGTVFIVFVYTIFILLEESTFKKKLEKLFPNKDRFDETYEVISKVEVSVSKYLGLKTLICLATSILSYFAMIIIGVDFPVFWAFLIFLLNYIPILGSYAATLAPFIFSLLQFGSFPPALAVLLSIGAIQVTIGNFIDPRVMGNRVNLSPLVIILSLSFWGAIWGIIGMFLSVPLMVILVITFSKIPKFKPIAIMMSRNGELE
jgi:predicted PurR-regulated permease PerM